MLVQALVVVVVLGAVGACVWMVLATSRGAPPPAGPTPPRGAEADLAALVADLDARVQRALAAVPDPGVRMALDGRRKVSLALPPSQQRLSLQEILIDVERLPTVPAPRALRPSDPLRKSMSAPRSQPPPSSAPRATVELIDLSPDQRDGWLARSTVELLRERVAAILGRGPADTLLAQAGPLPEELRGWQRSVDDGSLARWIDALVARAGGGLGPDRVRSLLELSARDLAQRYPLASFPRLLATFPDGCLTAEKSQASVRESLWSDFLESQRQLHDAQEQLVAREKMAALGQLVAGVAHEINTPLGIALTALSHLAEKLKDFNEQYKLGQVKKSQLQELMTEGEEATRLALENLRRGAQLVASFKKVAVDQTSEERRRVSLRGYVDEVFESLKPLLRGTRLRVAVDVPPVEVDTYPGALSQVLTNLVQNSTVHAYEAGQEGRLTVDATVEDEVVTMVYRDDGRGMPAEVAGRVFEPFFTTRRAEGGSGLGMHVVHNLVTEVLQGEITVRSEPGRGASFTLRFPATVGGAP